MTRIMLKGPVACTMMDFLIDTHRKTQAIRTLLELYIIGKERENDPCDKEKESMYQRIIIVQNEC